jgi:hypothetical protein
MLQCDSRPMFAFATAVSIALLSIGCDASKIVAADPNCSTSALTGSYGSQRNGQTAPGTAFTAVGLVVFDGRGNSVAQQDVSTNGVFSAVTNVLGKYAINADCTGTESDSGGNVVAKLLVVHAGDEVLGMSMVVGNSVALHYERIEGACANATLTGTYGFQRNGQSGPGAPLLAIGNISFDGHGNEVADQTSNKSGTVNSVHQVGTYQVNSDCTGAQIDTTGKVFSRMVVAHGGDEVLGMSITPGNNVVIHYERMK